MYSVYNNFGFGNNVNEVRFNSLYLALAEMNRRKDNNPDAIICISNEVTGKVIKVAQGSNPTQYKKKERI